MMPETNNFAEEQVKAVLSWHSGLFPMENGYPGDRAGRAQLKRCGTIMDAIGLPQTHKLLQTMRGKGLDPCYDNQLVMLAVLLASMDKEGTPTRKTFAAMLGQAESGDQPRLSKIRWGSLLAALKGNDHNLQIQLLRRAIRISRGNGFNHRQFVRDILFFDDRTLRDWNYQYFQTPPRRIQADDQQQNTEIQGEQS